MSGLTLRKQLGNISIPTLVVGGDRDVTIGVEQILLDYLALPELNRYLHIYHGIGHSPNVEVSTSFASLLTRFVSEANVRKAKHVVLE